MKKHKSMISLVLVLVFTLTTVLTGCSAGKDGTTPVIGENGNWYIDGEDTGIYAGDSQAEKVTLTFKELGKEYTMEVPVGTTVKYYVPESSIATFVNWYTGLSAIKEEIAGLTSLTTANVLKYYGYGINLEKNYPELWNSFVTSALSDDSLTASEAKAFAYHYAYQLTDGNVYLGAYGNSRNIVDYSIAK